MRLDKYLSQAGIGSRKDVKKIIKNGLVFVNGKSEKDASAKVLLTDKVLCDDKLVEYKEFVYIMLNKPSGYISATYDKKNQTVLDLIDGYDSYELFPVGRLDKDTQGLIILTNDGQLSHKVLSPKNHIDKRYLVGFEGVLSEKDADKFREGIQLKDEYVCQPAKINLCSSCEMVENIQLYKDYHEAQIVIKEGKYHQVKRMFQSTGKHVVYLKRIAMGKLWLDKTLAIGEYRELSELEVELLQKKSM